MGRDKTWCNLHAFNFPASQSSCLLMCWQLCTQRHPARRPRRSHFQNAEASSPHKNLENNNWKQKALITAFLLPSGSQPWLAWRSLPVATSSSYKQTGKWGLWFRVVDWHVFSQTLENIFLMRGCLLWHADISMSSSLLPESLSFGSRRRARRGMSSPRGSLRVLQSHFPVCSLFLGSIAGSAEIRLC